MRKTTNNGEDARVTKVTQNKNKSKSKNKMKISISNSTKRQSKEAAGRKSLM